MEKYSFSSSFRGALLTLILLLAPCGLTAQIGGTAGAFARMGFGARGIGLGNAMVASTDGEINSYYNPALSPFATERIATASFAFLSLDRYINFVSYTQAIKPTAGLSFGIINSGVRNIDGRDEDGAATGPLSTTEDQFYLSFANRLTPNFSIGATIKLYYARLYDQVSTTTVGFDLGAYYQVTPDLGLGAAIRDLNSKYKWDTQALYGQPDGGTTTDTFPTLRTFGVSYHLRQFHLVVNGEVENSSASSTIFRAGAEYSFLPEFSVRMGFDRLDGSDNSTGAKPSFGFSVRNPLGRWTPVLDYAYMIEPYAPSGIHVVSISAAF
ncbi:MAG TPA: PorV/PorQ family protein [Bacteroidota bacterium]|nr:PorV/PorQ family protein [Bacteroidota bacterium]